VPSLQRALLQKANVDLKPIAGNARTKIAAAIAELQKNEDDVKVQADITALRLTDIAFDAKTLRVIAAAEGSISALITKLPEL
jgi:hypothetical protein